MLHKWRKVLLGLFAVWIIITVVYSSKLQPTNKQLQLLPEGDRYRTAADLERAAFLRSERSAQCAFIHGVLTREESKSVWHPWDIGVARYDPGFTPDAPTFQEQYLGFCDRMRSYTYDYSAEPVLCTASVLLVNY